MKQGREVEERDRESETREGHGLSPGNPSACRGQGDEEAAARRYGRHSSQRTRQVWGHETKRNGSESR